MSAATLEAIAASIERINARLDALAEQRADVVLSRAEAAKQLKVSLRQLQRLVAAGLLSALPSGIARAELERYAKAPPVALPRAMTKPKRERTAQDEAARLTQLLKARARRARS